MKGTGSTQIFLWNDDVCYSIAILLGKEKKLALLALKEKIKVITRCHYCQLPKTYKENLKQPLVISGKKK